MAGPQEPELNNFLRTLWKDSFYGHRGTPSPICIKNTQTPQLWGGQGLEGCPSGSARLVPCSPHSTERIPFCVTFNSYR